MMREQLPERPMQRTRWKGVRAEFSWQSERLFTPGRALEIGIFFNWRSGIEPESIFRNFDHPIWKIAAESSIPEIIEQQVQKNIPRSIARPLAYKCCRDHLS